MAQWYPTREILRFGRVWSQKRRQSSTPQVPYVQYCVFVCVCKKLKGRYSNYPISYRIHIRKQTNILITLYQEQHGTGIHPKIQTFYEI